MTEQDFTLIQTWIEGEQKALEWSVGERTFQICGLRGLEGCYERFFRQGNHPTRRVVGDEEVIEALQKATSPLELYRGEKGSGRFFENSQAVFEEARKVL